MCHDRQESQDSQIIFPPQRRGAAITAGTSLTGSGLGGHYLIVMVSAGRCDLDVCPRPEPAQVAHWQADGHPHFCGHDSSNR